MVKGAFIDRDGVINHNDRSKTSGPYYTLYKDQIEFIDGAVDSMRVLGDAGFKIYWITCQNAIVEGKASYTQIDDICDYMRYKVHESTGVMVDYAICTTPTEDSELKVIAKRDAVLRFAIRDNINLRDSFGAGDARSDILAFRRAGIGHLAHIDIPRGDHCVTEADVTFPNLKESVINLINPRINTNILSTLKNLHSIEKVWGNEYWLVNSKDGNYCSKILKLKEGHKSSIHYHEKKHETFMVLSGIVHINHSGLLHTCVVGDKVTIERREPHWFMPISGDAYLLEVSTYHEDEDCMRIEASR